MWGWQLHGTSRGDGKVNKEGGGTYDSCGTVLLSLLLLPSPFLIQDFPHAMTTFTSHIHVRISFWMSTPFQTPWKLGSYNRYPDKIFLQSSLFKDVTFDLYGHDLWGQMKTLNNHNSRTNLDINIKLFGSTLLSHFYVITRSNFTSMTRGRSFWFKSELKPGFNP